MRYEFRLAELLGHTPDRKKRLGRSKTSSNTLAWIAIKWASLLKNEAKYIRSKRSRVCAITWVEHGYASADQLPGALFAVKPEHFWELLARRRRLEICVGVRRPEQTDTPDTAWVVASDAVLLGEMLSGVTTLGGTDKLARSMQQPRTDLPTHPELLKQTLVWSLVLFRRAKRLSERPACMKITSRPRATGL